MPVIYVGPFCLLIPLRQKTFDVRILGSAEYFVRSFKNNLTVAQHQESRVHNAECRPLAFEGSLAAAIDSIFGRQGESVPQTMGDEHARNTLKVAQCNDEFINASRRYGIQSRRGFVIE